MTKKNNLEKFGFSFEAGGAHLARTMMLGELAELLRYVPDSTSDKASYFTAITDANCLAKRSGRTRTLTARHLADLYGLDDSFLLFRALKYFWFRDEASRPLLALQLAYTRDAVFRMSSSLILKAEPGTQVFREDVEQFLEKQNPERFSEATLKSTAQNINSSWTQSGHLQGRVKKIRTQPDVSPGAIAYALLLGYLQGVRGEELFSTEYMKLLDCAKVKAVKLAEDASRKGWIVFKRVGNVIDVAFPNLMNEQEMEWLREQG